MKPPEGKAPGGASEGAPGGVKGKPGKWSHETQGKTVSRRRNQTAKLYAPERPRQGGLGNIIGGPCWHWQDSFQRRDVDGCQVAGASWGRMWRQQVQAVLQEDGCRMSVARSDSSWVWVDAGIFYFVSSLERHVHAKSLQLCLTLCGPIDCSPPGSHVHGILQGRILE